MLYRRPDIKNALSISHMKNGYLYEHFNHLLPYDHCGQIEVGLWSLFYEDYNRKNNR